MHGWPTTKRNLTLVYEDMIAMLQQAQWWDRQCEAESPERVLHTGQHTGQYEVSEANLTTPTGLALSAITHDTRQWRWRLHGYDEASTATDPFTHGIMYNTRAHTPTTRTLPPPTPTDTHCWIKHTRPRNQ